MISTRANHLLATPESEQNPAPEQLDALNAKFRKKVFWNPSLFTVKDILNESQQNYNKSPDVYTYLLWERDINEAYLFVRHCLPLNSLYRSDLDELIRQQHATKVTAMQNHSETIATESLRNTYTTKLTQLNNNACILPTTKKLKAWKKEIDSAQNYLKTRINPNGQLHPNDIEFEQFLIENDNAYNALNNYYHTGLKNKTPQEIEAQEAKSDTATQPSDNNASPPATLTWKNTSLVNLNDPVTVWSWSRSFFNPKRQMTFANYLEELTSEKATPSQKEKGEKIKFALRFNDKAALKRALQDQRHGFNFMHITSSTGMTIYKSVTKSA